MWPVSVCFPFYRLSCATRDCRLLATAAFLTPLQQLVCTRQREEETLALQLLPKLFQKQLGDMLEHPQTGKFSHLILPVLNIRPDIAAEGWAGLGVV